MPSHCALFLRRLRVERLHRIKEGYCPRSGRSTLRHCGELPCRRSRSVFKTFQPMEGQVEVEQAAKGNSQPVHAKASSDSRWREDKRGIDCREVRRMNTQDTDRSHSTSPLGDG